VLTCTTINIGLHSMQRPPAHHRSPTCWKMTCICVYATKFWVYPMLGEWPNLGHDKLLGRSLTTIAPWLGLSIYFKSGLLCWVLAADSLRPTQLHTTLPAASVVETLRTQLRAVLKDLLNKDTQYVFQISLLTTGRMFTPARTCCWRPLASTATAIILLCLSAKVAGVSEKL